MPPTTQYDMLLKELEQLDHQLRIERQQAARTAMENDANETTGQEDRHRPMLSGGHGETHMEEQLQAI